jgi:2-polyprenyl-3-methyl-5-hydroxy-6-metoxy-1,4-benzoquinol methylase
MSYEQFLRTTPRSKDEYLLFSAHRPYQHDELSYDEQYKVPPIDYLAGEGILHLVKDLQLLVDSPILELGCGTGKLTVGLISVFGADAVLATDASTNFLDITRKKLLENKLAIPHLGILRFEDIGVLPDDAFGLIVIRSALHHVDMYDDFLFAASRKLRPGGAIIFQEPLYEGLFLLGLIAKSVRQLTHDADIQKDLTVLVDAMSFYCRTNVDKSLAEDKHVFRLNNILSAANRAGLSLQFFPNKAYEDFAGDPSVFDYSYFAKSYLGYCMSFKHKTVEFYMEKANEMLQYIKETSDANNAPECYGVFVLTRPTAPRG